MPDGGVMSGKTGPKDLVPSRRAGVGLSLQDSQDERTAAPMDNGQIDIDVRSHPHFPASIRDYATGKVRSALHHTSRPVLYARVALDRSAHHAVPRPVRASVEVDLNGTVLVAKADARTATEAIDLMKDRLAARLARTAR